MRNKRSFVFGMEVCMKVMQLYNVIGCRHKKNAHQVHDERLKKLAATYSPAFAVPSALEGLTSVFGMGTGEPLC